MKIYLLPRGIGVSDGKPCENDGSLSIELSGDTVTGIFVGDKYYTVVGGRVTICTDGLEGVVKITAYNRPLRRSWRCEDIYFMDDLVIPIPRMTPAEYVAMAATAEKMCADLSKKIENLEEAVYGVPLFGKEKEK